MGDMLSLIEKVEENIDEKQALEMQRKMLANDFSLEDFREQLRQVKKLGSLQSIMDMLPNVGPFKELQNAEIDPKELVRTEAIINSMTAKERVNADLLNGSRRRRIAKGSGTTVQQVNQLLKQYRQARAMMRGIATGGAGSKKRKRSKGKRRGHGLRGPAPGGMGFRGLLGR